MADHYFSAAPASAAERRDRSVRLGGRDVDVTTAGGVFSPGPISLDAALRAREAGTAVRVWALDVNERALGLTADNAATLGLTNVNAVTDADVPADLGFSAIWSNPPIRVGKAALHDMLLTWLPRLLPDASAHLVVAKKLGADSLLRWLDTEPGAEFSAERIATAKGFRVLRVDRSA